MKYQICVSGAATGSTVQASHQLAYDLGKAIAKAGKTLTTGATIGLPWYSAKGAFSVKDRVGASVGFSPASTFREHVTVYKLPTVEFDYINFTGMAYVGRNIHLVRSSDALITVGGRMGSLHEFATAVECGKPVAILEKSGGTSDKIKFILDESKKIKSPIVFERDPKVLVEKLLKLVEADDKKAGRILNEAKKPNRDRRYK